MTVSVGIIANLQVRKCGSISGGFIDKDRCRFQLYDAYLEAKKASDEKTTELEAAKHEVQDVEGQINATMTELQRIETKILRSKLGQLQSDLNANRESIASKRRSIDEKKARVLELEARVTGNLDTIEALQKELE